MNYKIMKIETLERRAHEGDTKAIMALAERKNRIEFKPDKSNDSNKKTWKKRTVEEIKAETNKSLKLIKDTVMSYVESPERMMEFLEFQSRFYQYSIRNTILIQLQNHGARFCQQAKAWNREGHMILKGQHGMQILVPKPITFIVLPDGKNKPLSQATTEEKQKVNSGELELKKVMRFGLGTTFDIAQTDYPEDEYPERISRGKNSKSHEKCYNGLKKYTESLGIKVYDSEKEKDINGGCLFGFCRYNPDGSKEIHLARNLKDTQKLSVGGHEFGHAVMHGGNNNSSTDRKEVEADMFSIMIDNHFGLPIEETRKSHLKHHFEMVGMEATRNAKLKNKDGKVIDVAKVRSKAFMEIFDTVNKAYREHIDEIDKVISEM